MQIDLSKIRIREIGPKDVDLLTTYRMAYLAEMQGERSEEYQQQLKTELNQYFSQALAENRFFCFSGRAEWRNIKLRRDGNQKNTWRFQPIIVP